jgi:hypothetical protein
MLFAALEGQEWVELHLRSPVAADYGKMCVIFTFVCGML